MVASVNSLPPEMLTRIFSDVSCFCSNWTDYDAKPTALSPIVLAAVCRHWRRVAINYTLLWAHIDLVVDVMDDDGKYPSPNIWVERSNGALLHLHVFQPRYDTDEYHDEELEEAFASPESRREPAPMVRRLVDFLESLVPQLCSLTVSLSHPYGSTLVMLLDCWATHGTYGLAKALKVYANPEILEIRIRPSESHKTFLGWLEVLHLHNSTFPRDGFSFNNLIELEMEVGRSGRWALTPSDLADVLASCPNLHRLSIDNVLLFETPARPPDLVVLNNLRLLRVGGFYNHLSNGAAVLESVLAVINSGQNVLDMGVSLHHLNEPFQQALDAVSSFVTRSDVATLRIQGFDLSGPDNSPYFATQLGPLPHVRTLVLDHWCFCDVMHYEDRLFDSSEICDNPRPINPELVLWPHLRNLYLDHCVLQKEYLRQFISLHAIQSLYMRNCYDERWYCGAFDAGSETSAEYVRILSELVPNVVHVPDGYDDWPLILL